MAINTPLSDAKLQSYDYSSPQVMQSLQALNQGEQAGFAQSQDAENQQKLAKLKALLQGQSETATMGKQQAALEDLKDKNPSAQVKVGDISVGVDPAVAIQKKQMQTTAKEANQLHSVYGKDANDLEGAASQVESGLTGLNEGTPQGDKTAVAALTRLADGKGQRMTQAQLASMTPESAQGSVEKMMNYWTSTAESGLSPAQKAAAGKLLMAHSSRLQNEYNDTLNEFKTQAPLLAPTLAQTGQLDQYTKSFGSKGSAIFDRIGKLQGQLNSAPAVAAATAAPSHNGVMDRIKGGVSSLAQLLGGGGNTATAAPTPVAPQQAQPVGPSGFDPDSFLGGK